MNQDEKIIEKLKQEYENIPVPPQARVRMQQGINQAKKEMNQEQNQIKKAQKRGNIMKLVRTTGGTAAAAMIAITLMANFSPTTANAMEKLPVIGSIAKVVTFRTFEDQTKNFEANIQVPQVTLDGTKEAAVNKSIEAYADELIARYEAELSASQGEGHYAMDSTYQVVTDSEKYLSIRIDTTLAMASGTQFVKIFTVDKSTGEVMTLSGLFQSKPEILAQIGENIKEQMRAQMAQDDGKSYFLDSEVPASDFTGLNGTESFYINNAGELVITFDEYVVAPGYMGAVEFTIPRSVTGTF